MKLGDVLQRVPGLDKRFVHYLEAQGDIRPRRLPKTRIARRDYRPEDVWQVSRLWDYYQRGYSLAGARALLARSRNELAYVLLRVDPRRRAEAVQVLGRSDRVLEAAVVYGESTDLLAKLEADRPEEVFQTLHQAFDQALLLGSPTILYARANSHWPGRPARGRGMLAYALIKVPAKHLDGVMEQLRMFDGISEASVIYGETDIIAKLEVENQDALDQLVIRSIQGLPEVEATRTFIAVGGMHWQRASVGESPHLAVQD